MCAAMNLPFVRDRATCRATARAATGRPRHLLRHLTSPGNKSSSSRLCIFPGTWRALTLLTLARRSRPYALTSSSNPPDHEGANQTQAMGNSASGRRGGGGGYRSTNPEPQKAEQDCEKAKLHSEGQDPSRSLVDPRPVKASAVASQRFDPHVTAWCGVEDTGCFPLRCLQSGVTGSRVTAWFYRTSQNATGSSSTLCGGAKAINVRWTRRESRCHWILRLPPACRTQQSHTNLKRPSVPGTA